MKKRPIPTTVFDTYWRFAAERQAIFVRRLVGTMRPWTTDPILQIYRFTNAYRASDRISQYLIREVQQRPDRPQNAREIFFRTLLFKIFNRIETWETIEREVGPVEWRTFDVTAVTCLLDRMWECGQTIYSAAYIMPAPPFGHRRKHTNHLSLLLGMMNDRLPESVEQERSLQDVYQHILTYPSLGRFLAFQYAIDLNYSDFLDFAEGDFVIAGPGALDGISKCFEDLGGMTPEEIIHWTADRQDAEFKRVGVDFCYLFGRRLQPVDCQNLFCEIAKYARIAHLEIGGVTGRTRIKQNYRPNRHPLPPLAYPKRWGLKLDVIHKSATRVMHETTVPEEASVYMDSTRFAR